LVTYFNTISTIFISELNNQSTWHKDQYGNIFNADALVVAIGASLVGATWIMEYAEKNPITITIDQLALICYAVSFIS
jgi:uncharacterized FAD-dependent dehydrogenase